MLWIQKSGYLKLGSMPHCADKLRKLYVVVAMLQDLLMRSSSDGTDMDLLFCDG
jgi:hypothetical protein